MLFPTIGQLVDDETEEAEADEVEGGMHDEIQLRTSLPRKSLIDCGIHEVPHDTDEEVSIISGPIPLVPPLAVPVPMLSTAHPELHPSPFVWFPSSHPSVPSLVPFPHDARSQVAKQLSPGVPLLRP